MSSNLKHRRKLTREAGLVSIMVTLILMIVISLIVLGFAQISRRNQRQALDRQLSTQAFYASETGINDARKLINTALLAGDTVPAKPDCTSGSGAEATFYAGLSPNLNSTSPDEAKYTCVIVDPTPTTLLYSDVGTQSTIIPLLSDSGANFSYVTLNWQTKDNTTTPTTNCPTGVSGVFSATSSWNCGYGVLRVDLVPTSGSFTYSSLQNSDMTTFLVPLSSGGSTSAAYAAGGSNNRIGVDCSDTDCTFNITGLTTNEYYMRVSSIYKNVALQVNGYDSSNNALKLSGAQAVIDSTGKAQDVLRRVQVHVPLTQSSKNQLSDYVMESTDSICKRFVVMDNYFDTQVDGVTSTSPLCQP